MKEKVRIPMVPPDGSYPGIIQEMTYDEEQNRERVSFKLDNGYEKIKTSYLDSNSHAVSFEIFCKQLAALGYQGWDLDEAREHFRKSLPQRAMVKLHKEGQIESYSFLGEPKAAEEDETPPINLVEYAFNMAEPKHRRINGMDVLCFDGKTLIFLTCDKQGNPDDPHGRTWGCKALGSFPLVKDLTFREAWAERDWRYRYMARKGWKEWEKPEEE